MDCHYENLIGNNGGTANCCCGQCDIDMTCAPNSTTGSGLWQPMYSTLCPAEGCGSEGEVTSPNYPNNYPNGLLKTETIQVEEGLILSLQFTAFDIESHSTCAYDHLTITDGDGTTLMEKSCGSSLPATITSRTNSVTLIFTTDDSYAKTGWSVNWTAVTPGLVSQCGPFTRDDQLGPFFVRNAPEKRNLAPSSDLRDPSKAVILEGKILGKDCKGVSDAMVEVWYAGGTPAHYTFPAKNKKYWSKYLKKNGYNKG